MQGLRLLQNLSKILKHRLTKVIDLQGPGDGPQYLALATKQQYNARCIYKPVRQGTLFSYLILQVFHFF